VLASHPEPAAWLWLVSLGMPLITADCIVWLAPPGSPTVVVPGDVQ